jgi:TonB family protein
MIFIAATSTPDAAPAPAPLAPTGKWVVDGERTECILARRFGAGDQQIVFGLVPVDLTNQLTIRLKLAHPIRFQYGQPAKVTVLPSAKAEEQPIEGGLPGTSVQDDRLNITLDGLLLRRAEVVTGLEIAAGGKTIASIMPTDLSAALAALDTCEDQLLNRWGIDAAQRAMVATAPVRKGDDVMPDDYPAAALRVHAQGRVIVRYRVDVDGKVEDCQVIDSSGNRALDDGTCDAMARIHYSSALDAHGKPIAVQQIRRFVWRIPG